jgi:hypothetical protein
VSDGMDLLIDAVCLRINNGFNLCFVGDEGGVSLIEATWRRDYSGKGESDPRCLIRRTLTDTLNAILAYENEADAREAAEGP